MAKNTDTMNMRQRRWYDDKPMMTALVSGFFSTLITLLNIFFKE